MNVEIWVIAVLFGLLFLVPFSSRGRRLGKNRELDTDLIEDPEALRQAEQQAQGIPLSEFVHLVTFNSMEGYSEDYIVKLVSYLGENGVQCHHDSHASPGGNMRSYSVRCAAEQVELAHKLLKSFQEEETEEEPA